MVTSLNVQEINGSEKVMSDLKNIVVQVERAVMTVSKVMAKLVELGYEESPTVLTSAYNAHYIYTSDGIIKWSDESPTKWEGEEMKVNALLDMEQ
jgi:hypothetical protein